MNILSSLFKTKSESNCSNIVHIYGALHNMKSDEIIKKISDMIDKNILPIIAWDLGKTMIGKSEKYYFTLSKTIASSRKDLITYIFYNEVLKTFLEVRYNEIVMSKDDKV
ncbi:hypothetical protein J6O48_13745 [bacterium]|nr:hypothetical protein [bacterium]